MKREAFERSIADLNAKLDAMKRENIATQAKLSRAEDETSRAREKLAAATEKEKESARYALTVSKESEVVRRESAILRSSNQKSAGRDRGRRERAASREARDNRAAPAVQTFREGRDDALDGLRARGRRAVAVPDADADARGVREPDEQRGDARGDALPRARAVRARPTWTGGATETRTSTPDAPAAGRATTKDISTTSNPIWNLGGVDAADANDPGPDDLHDRSYAHVVPEQRRFVSPPRAEGRRRTTSARGWCPCSARARASPGRSRTAGKTPGGSRPGTSASAWSNARTRGKRRCAPSDASARWRTRRRSKGSETPRRRTRRRGGVRRSRTKRARRRRSATAPPRRRRRSARRRRRLRRRRDGRRTKPRGTDDRRRRRVGGGGGGSERGDDARGARDRRGSIQRRGGETSRTRRQRVVRRAPRRPGAGREDGEALRPLRARGAGVGASTDAAPWRLAAEEKRPTHAAPAADANPAARGEAEAVRDDGVVRIVELALGGARVQAHEFEPGERPPRGRARHDARGRGEDDRAAEEEDRVRTAAGGRIARADGGAASAQGGAR